MGKVISSLHIPGADGWAGGSQQVLWPSLPEGDSDSPRVTLYCGLIQDNPESQAQKRPRPSANGSILAEAKDSTSASDQGPAKPTAHGSCQLPAPGISLKVAANIVVKCLTPFYKEGKFASKVGEAGGLCSPSPGTLGCSGGGAGSVSGRGIRPPEASRRCPQSALPVGHGCGLLGGRAGACALGSCLPSAFRNCSKASPATSPTHWLSGPLWEGAVSACIAWRGAHGGSAGRRLALTSPRLDL